MNLGYASTHRSRGEGVHIRSIAATRGGFRALGAELSLPMVPKEQKPSYVGRGKLGGHTAAESGGEGRRGH
jgi:hypothetical protein